MPGLALNKLIFRYGPLQGFAEILVCVLVATLAMCFTRLISCTPQHEFLGEEGNADVAIVLPVMAITQTQMLLYFTTNTYHIVVPCLVQNSVLHLGQ